MSDVGEQKGSAAHRRAFKRIYTSNLVHYQKMREKALKSNRLGALNVWNTVHV